jgi:hypothetical protein
LEFRQGFSNLCKNEIRIKTALRYFIQAQQQDNKSMNTIIYLVLLPNYINSQSLETYLEKEFLICSDFLFNCQNSHFTNISN